MTLLIIIKNYIMRIFLFIFLLSTVVLTSCGPLWIKNANKTFGQKKQKSKYSKPRGDLKEMKSSKVVYV